MHAIPSARQVLRDGDVISIDCGAVLDGWHGDAAITVGVGEVDPAAAADGRGRRGRDVGGHRRRGARRGLRAGPADRHLVRDRERGPRAPARYGIVDGYGGHGIGTEMHQDPHVLNHGRPGKGPRLVPGLALGDRADAHAGLARRRWSCRTAGRWSPGTARWRSTSSTRWRSSPDGVWVLTAPDGGRERLGDLVTTRARPPAPTARPPRTPARARLIASALFVRRSWAYRAWFDLPAP